MGKKTDPETNPGPLPRGKRSEATRTLLLDTAEKLFAARGYDGTGVRQIAEEAGVNLGAIHYYWRTKEALCRDALERRLVPLLEQRSAGIDEVAARDGGLAEVLDASHRPSLLVGGIEDEAASSFRMFYGRMLFDPAPEVREILDSLLDQYARRFVQMVKDRCSGLSDNEFYWRLTFLYGAFLYAHTRHTRTTALWGDRFEQANFADAGKFLTRFLEGGLRAPPADQAWPEEESRGCGSRREGSGELRRRAPGKPRKK